MKLVLALLPLAFTHLSAQTPVPERGGNLPVFRTVLDEKPRVIVIRMGPEKAVAFDCENGLLWKYWQAETGQLPVKLQGAVYNGAHGPQPVTQGTTHFTDDQPQLIPSAPDADLRYLGHLAHSDGTTTVRWAFRNAENKRLATVSVTPTFSNGTVTLDYKLEAEPASGFQVALRPPGTKETPKPLSTTPLQITLKP